MVKSWYPSTKLDETQLKYLHLIQTIWKVKDADDQWISYKLTPHQIKWHSEDIACLGNKAKHRVVVKSRNTSFTVSSIISTLMDIPNRNKQIIPVVRLNMNRAVDLIEEIKEHIKHMTPIKLSDGTLYPFDPNLVYMEKSMSITFPNGTEIRAFPANAASAESIRGMRIIGSAGIIDEGNFMASFQSIYIALRDAARGSSSDGKQLFQMNIGTTRKGRMTNFNIWFEDIIKTNPNNVIIFNWPVLQHEKLDMGRSLIEQSKEIDLIPIVPWHNINDLENKRKENINTFLEEYMAVLVDSEEQLYEYSIVEAAIDTSLQNSEPEEGKIYVMGIDPASTSDFFALSIFDKTIKTQKFLYYKRNVQLKTMESFCENLIHKWKPYRVTIDGNGLGFQLSQTLKAKFGNVIKIIRGVSAVKTPGRITGNIPMKEFLHTNMLKMMNYNEIKLIQDETQIRHYLMWKKNYECEHDVTYGHGDIVMANGYALLPDNWKTSGSNDVIVMREKEQEIPDVEVQTVNINWGE